MVGNNEMNLNEATLKAAIQYFFDEVVFSDGHAPTVVSVDQDQNISVKTFIVSVHNEAEER